MHRFLLLLVTTCLVLGAGCATTATDSATETAGAPPGVATPERLAADTPNQTVGGATFIAPADWSFSVRGPATILEAPEGEVHVSTPAGARHVRQILSKPL